MSTRWTEGGVARSQECIGGNGNEDIRLSHEMIDHPYDPTSILGEATCRMLHPSLVPVSGLGTRLVAPIRALTG